MVWARRLDAVPGGRRLARDFRKIASVYRLLHGLGDCWAFAMGPPEAERAAINTYRCAVTGDRSTRRGDASAVWFSSPLRRTIATRVHDPSAGRICSPALLQVAAFQEGDQSPGAGVSRSRLAIRRSEKAVFDRLDDLPTTRSCVREQRGRQHPFATDDMS